MQELTISSRMHVETLTTAWSAAGVPGPYGSSGGAALWVFVPAVIGFIAFAVYLFIQDRR